MKPNIRKKTCLIVRKNNQYLVGWNCVMGCLNWSTSQYDAWRTRDKNTAEYVAMRTGGTLMLFNPIVNQIAVYQGGRNGRGKVL